jgi:hypothetical protein
VETNTVLLLLLLSLFLQGDLHSFQLDADF